MESRGNSVFVVQGELALVVSSMRRNTRWAPLHQDEQDPLLQAFGQLKQRLARVSDLGEVDSNELLMPFLSVIRSEITTGPITGVALSAVHKFLSYGLITPESVGATSCIEAIADAVAHVRFVGTDWASDEVVLMKMLQVARTLLCSRVGSLCSNEAVVELVQACLRVCFEKVLSELLRRTAEHCLGDMIQVLFARLGEVADADPAASVSTLVMVTADSLPAELELRQRSRPPSESSPPVDALSSAPVVIDEKQRTMGPYGAPCIRELLRFLVTMVNRRDRVNTDPVVTLGLGLLTTALETAGPALGRFPSVMEYVEDSLCRNIFALLKSENPALAAAAFRLCFLVFAALRHRLKFQLSHFLSLMKTLEYPTYEHREAALDCLLQLSRLPSFWPDLYLNFDCHLFCPDVCAALVAGLGQHAFPEEQRLLTTHVTALDALLALAQEIEARPDPAAATTAASPSTAVESPASDAATPRAGAPNAAIVGDGVLPAPGTLAAVRERKRLLLEGMEKFNDSPKKGLQFLLDNGLLPSLEPAAVAAFLRSDPRLDKAKIGEYIGGPKHIDVLRAFVCSFDFSHASIDEALRMFLTSFRLPGEAQIIQRILECFGGHWFATYKGARVVADADTAFVLAYAVIILNVDLHNPKNKNRMTLTDFIRNHRGLNATQDFPREFLESIYHSIKTREIVMPEEQTGALKEDHEWQTMLARGRDPVHGAMVPCPPTGEYDRDVFLQTWRPMLAALAAVFDAARDEAVLTRVLQGFRTVASISARFGLSEVLDGTVISLAKRLFATIDGSIRAADDAIAVPFGRSSSARAAATTMFDLARRHGDYLREGWKNILQSMLHMYNARLLPASLVTAEDVLAADGVVTLLPAQKETVVRADSIFSAISSFLLSNDDTARRETSTDDVAAREVAQQCVTACNVPGLFEDSKFLQLDSLTELCKSLASMSQAAAPPLLGTQPSEGSAVLFLELLINVTLWNQDRIALLWQTTYAHLVELVAGVTEPTFLVRRAVAGLLRLAHRLLRKADVAAQVVDSVRILQALQPPVEMAVAEMMSAVLVSLVKENAVHLDQCRGWDAVLGLAARCRHSRRSQRNALLCAQAVIDDPAVLTAASFPPLLSLLRDLASSLTVPVALPSPVERPAARTRSSATVPPPAPPLPTAAAPSDKTDKDNLEEQLLDLLFVLHTRAGDIAAASSLNVWSDCWQPLLQAIATFCSDARRPVRQHALTVLQRALLLPDMERLPGPAWRACLDTVLFPLLTRLLEPLAAPGTDTAATEETRMRACTLLCKVFLQHLTALLGLGDFEAVWLHLLDFLDRYMHADNSELLLEAVPESLKNMLLVMSTAGIFRPATSEESESAGGSDVASLWTVTWARISHFLPTLHAELFPSATDVPVAADPAVPAPSSAAAAPPSPTPASAVLTAPAVSPSRSSAPLTAPAPGPASSAVAAVTTQPLAGPPSGTAAPPKKDVGLHPHPIIV
eukprot:m.24517 g.24517  ORF g.24517 m.24517 type:complete len:1480 (+) comp8714_c0_seq1:128-4567(+)